MGGPLALGHLGPMGRMGGGWRLAAGGGWRGGAYRGDEEDEAKHEERTPQPDVVVGEAKAV